MSNELFATDANADMVALGREMLRQSEIARAKSSRLPKADPRWRANNEVYEAQRSHRDAGIVAEDFGLDLAGRSEPRDSWQAQMSDSGEPHGNFSRPFDLLQGVDRDELRALARTRKGRRRLQSVVSYLEMVAR